MQMCELSLEETGLTRKRGAEILGEAFILLSLYTIILITIIIILLILLLFILLSEHEFDKEWASHGGKQYTRPADRKKNGRA